MRTWRVVLCTTTAVVVAACRGSSTTATTTGPRASPSGRPPRRRRARPKERALWSRVHECRAGQSRRTASPRAPTRPIPLPRPNDSCACTRPPNRACWFATVPWSLGPRVRLMAGRWGICQRRMTVEPVLSLRRVVRGCSARVEDLASLSRASFASTALRAFRPRARRQGARRHRGRAVPERARTFSGWHLSQRDRGVPPQCARRYRWKASSWQRSAVDGGSGLLAGWRDHGPARTSASRGPVSTASHGQRPGTIRRRCLRGVLQRHGSAPQQRAAGVREPSLSLGRSRCGEHAGTSPAALVSDREGPRQMSAQSLCPRRGRCPTTGARTALHGAFRC